MKYASQKLLSLYTQETSGQVIDFPESPQADSYFSESPQADSYFRARVSPA